MGLGVTAISAEELAVPALSSIRDSVARARSVTGPTSSGILYVISPLTGGAIPSPTAVFPVGPSESSAPASHTGDRCAGRAASSPSLPHNVAPATSVPAVALRPVAITTALVAGRTRTCRASSIPAGSTTPAE